MAQFDTIITTMQNGVTAINNLGSLIGVSTFTGPWTAYTPLVSSLTGTFTTVSATGRFKQLGSTVFVEIIITITTNGTAAGNVVASLPIAAVSSGAVLSGRENAAVGKMLQGLTQSGSIAIWNYDNTYPGADGYQLEVSGIYEAA